LDEAVGETFFCGWFFNNGWRWVIVFWGLRLFLMVMMEGVTEWKERKGGEDIGSHGLESPSV